MPLAPVWSQKNEHDILDALFPGSYQLYHDHSSTTLVSDKDLHDPKKVGILVDWFKMRKMASKLEAYPHLPTRRMQPNYFVFWAVWYNVAMKNTTPNTKTTKLERAAFLYYKRARMSDPYLFERAANRLEQITAEVIASGASNLSKVEKACVYISQKKKINGSPRDIAAEKFDTVVSEAIRNLSPEQQDRYTPPKRVARI